MWSVCTLVLGMVIINCTGSTFESKEARTARLVKQLEEDFQRYPNMSLVLLEKCKTLKPHRVAPCTFAVLDNDQGLFMKMMQTSLIDLITLANNHNAMFPDVPLRKKVPGSKCSKPPVTVNADNI